MDAFVYRTADGEIRLFSDRLPPGTTIPNPQGADVYEEPEFLGVTEIVVDR